MAAVARVAAAPRRGMTLIELVIALGILALLSSAIIVLLRQGIRSWDRLQTVMERQAQVRFVLDRFDRDAWGALLLTGANDELPTLTDQSVTWVTVTPAEPATLPRLERVLWRAEAQTDGTLALVRRAAPYPASPEGALGRAEVLLPALQACEFAFLYRNAARRQFLWRPLWEFPADGEQLLPRGVRLQMRAAADAPTTWSHVAEVPRGAVGFTEEAP